MRRLSDFNSRIVRSSTTGIALPVGFAAMLLFVAACETTETGRRTTDRAVAAEQEQPDSSSKASNGGSELAAIAERDVRAFLDRQQRTDTPSEPPQREQPRRSAQEIQWNMPAEPTKPPSGARDIELPDVRPSELFLLPDDQDEHEEKSSKKATAKEETSLERDRIRELVVDLSKELYRESTYADMPLRELMLIAATTIVTPDRALQPDAIPSLTQRERELLGEFQRFFIQIGSQLDGSRTADEVLVHALDELRATLSTDPELFLETMALCTRVGGFGDYDPFDRYSFLAHSEQQAVLYLEVAGFISELNQQGQWVTELSLQLTVYSDRDGIPVWREDWQTAVDVSRNKRQDFFMVQLITLPQALSVGKYFLKVRARDEKSGAEAEGSIPFEMVADPKLATGAQR